MNMTLFKYMSNGLEWRFENKRGDTIIVMCHDGSYGYKDGLFEVIRSWSDSKNGKSIGWITFGEVQKFIDELEKRE